MRWLTAFTVKLRLNFPNLYLYYICTRFIIILLAVINVSLQRKYLVVWYVATIDSSASRSIHFFSGGQLLTYTIQHNFNLKHISIKQKLKRTLLLACKCTLIWVLSDNYLKYNKLQVSDQMNLKNRFINNFINYKTSKSPNYLPWNITRLRNVS